VRLPTAFALTALLGLCAVPAGSQQFFTPGAEINGQISVQVNATLDDGAGYYEPIANHALTLYRNATDSTVLKTDDAGVLRFAVAPGTYRLASVAPVRWRGRNYRWNIPLFVQRRMSIVNLTPVNAAVTATRATETASVAGTERPVAQRMAPADALAPMAAGYSRKDGTTGVLFSFLLTGGGQFYAGKTAKGGALLGAALLSVVGAVSTSCSYAYDCDNTVSTAYLLTGLGIWVYSMASAPQDARDYNLKHSELADLHPTVDHRNGRTALGLALKF
jgi:hypothetical protein